LTKNAAVQAGVIPGKAKRHDARRLLMLVIDLVGNLLVGKCGSKIEERRVQKVRRAASAFAF
jgi:hypothetical protein